jgi:hypothetical protein
MSIELFKNFSFKQLPLKSGKMHQALVCAFYGGAVLPTGG